MKKHTGNKGELTHSLEEIQSIVDSYFDRCADTDHKPTWEGLALALDVTPQTLNNWLDADNPDNDGKGHGVMYNPEVAEIIKKAVARMADGLQQSCTSMDIFRLKQKHYGGYTDKQVVDQTQTLDVRVRITGADGKPI